MKKINLYYQYVCERKNVLMEFLYALFLKFFSYPRMILEVIIRKNFGERYFKLSTAITVALILALVPLAGGLTGDFFSGDVDACSWYVFIVLFLSFSIKHWRDNLHAPGAFDFARFSKYAGDIHPMFSRLGFWNWRPDVRTIETIFEPALFLMIGLLLHLVGFSLGMLIIISSIFYSMSYFAAYKRGDDFVLDMIDKMIMNEEMENAFVLDRPAEETRGVRFHAKKPKLYSLRQKLAEAMVYDPSKVEFTIAE